MFRLLDMENLKALQWNHICIMKMSVENRDQLEKLLNSMSDVINKGVSKLRSIKKRRVRLTRL